MDKLKLKVKHPTSIHIVDDWTGVNLKPSPSGLLVKSAFPAGFPIIPRKPPAGSKRSPLDVGYRYARKRATDVIDRHKRVLAKLRAEKPDSLTLKQTAQFRPVIKSS